MGDVTVVEDVLTHKGWRRVHLLSGRETDLKLARGEWMVSVPWESADAIHTLKYQEAGIWHCQLLWPMRGNVITVDGLDDQNGVKPKDAQVVLWTLTGKKERLSEAVDMAAWRYFAWFDKWPDTAWVGQRMAAYEGRKVTLKYTTVEIMAADWMPELGVGLGIKVGENHG